MLTFTLLILDFNQNNYKGQVPSKKPGSKRGSSKEGKVRVQSYRDKRETRIGLNGELVGVKQERIRRGRANTVDLLNSHLKAHYHSFLEYTYAKGNQMESPYNGRDNAQTKHLITPSKTSSAKNGLQHVESLDKGVTWIR